MPLLDTQGRALRSLRVSVTDRCNLRCSYCMPEEEYTWLPRRDLLSFEEIHRLTAAFVERGIEAVRLTGGEPLLRRDLDRLVGMLRSLPIRDISLTTNGVLLADRAAALHEAGLDRVTVSVDTLREERFRGLSRVGELGAILQGLAVAAAIPFRSRKVNTVVVRGFNDDELGDLLELGRRHRAEVRFIEYMDVGGATRWSLDQVVPRAEILQRLEEQWGPVLPLENNGSAPAERFRLGDGTEFGIIASTTAPFCGSCDRSRITADGQWLLCLYAAGGIDLRARLRAGASAADLAAVIDDAWKARRDRGAEERLGETSRVPLLDAEALRRDPHREMHTRGG